MPLPVLSAASLGDLQITTRAQENRLRIVELATDLQEFLVMPRILKKGSTITEDSTGKSFEWRVMVNGSGTAANVGLGYQDSTSIVDTTVTATADWRNSKVDWAMIGQESDMNAEPSKIVDLKMLREKASAISLIELMEANVFGPPVAVTDTLTPWGFSTWIVKNATEGFNGGAPSGYTTIGLNPTTYPRFKNYTAQYTLATDEDFVRKLNRAVEFTGFKTPVDGLPIINNSMRHMLFSNYGLIGPLQEYLKASNDNLGMDIGKYAGAVVVNRVPIARVPFLEADTTNPLYGIDMGAFKMYRLKNWWMRKSHVAQVPGHHTVEADYLDCTYQFVFVTRRTSFVLATGTTYPY